MRTIDVPHDWMRPINNPKEFEYRCTANVPSPSPTTARRRSRVSETPHGGRRIHDCSSSDNAPTGPPVDRVGKKPEPFVDRGEGSSHRVVEPR